ncbi:LysR family transcriptional regulator [Vibrio hangzhouensis]|uniref:DNA-binding transcriptional regulator, LysR family n=1 Tax=Vibrio hangzhouensis TaxID=462991 RepID=A0A1H6CJD1_9VIBR|nr:LysR family transcriptional regulator [Vibrio hangzhouensis]SEG72516.1 DNA-binding transcriptional regulator, LysR family [Vibrio hangzhouensis]
MNLEKLSRIDLNLLLCFSVLLEECNVTRAANRLCLSQSAVSKSLSKLRSLFDDPLFTRHAHGLSPTPRALQLKPKLDALMTHMQSITAPPEFSPTTSEYRFHIAAVESVYPLIMPHFLPAIFSQGPNLSISTHAWNEMTFERMQKGELDLGITGKDIDIRDAMRTMYPPSDIQELEVYRDNQMCLVRANHPILTQPWNLDTYLSLRHVQVRCDGSDRWLLDYKLSDMGRERDIAITVPDFNNAAALCSYTDFVFTAPKHFVHLVAEQMGLTVLPLPLEFPPMAYTLFWHKDRNRDPALNWLIDIIRQKTLHLR